jgi:DNA-binding CsgD family transcriptional regulator
MIRSSMDYERILVSLAIAVVLFSAIFDYFDDIGEGATFIDIVFDSLVNVFVVSTLLYIWFKRPRATQSRNKQLERVLKHSGEDAKRWREKASELLQGLGKKIDEQLNEWHLSPAEKEVAFLLIKGLSVRDIAGMRGTSEKTVRQQATQIYAKANLENRAELAAFFLEDLFLPKSLV